MYKSVTERAVPEAFANVVLPETVSAVAVVVASVVVPVTTWKPVVVRLVVEAFPCVV